jgi:excisionase family DNA binding protein
MEKLLLSPQDVADLLSVSRSYVYQLIATGDIPSIMLGTKKKGGRRVVPADLQAWIDKHRSGPERA